MKKILTFALVNLALFAFAFGPSMAVDPKFEIDLNRLEKKPVQVSGRSVAQKASGNLSARKSGRGSKSASAGKRKVRKRGASAKKRSGGKRIAAADSLKISRLSVPTVEEISLDQVRKFWVRLVPGVQKTDGPLEVAGRNFNISLDPDKFPDFTAVDGGRILLDSDYSLSDAVKVLLRNEEPRLRIVTESPLNGKAFMKELLAAANFYSVEEDFTIAFGTEPRLTVSADYKIERLPDSILQNEVILLNVGANGCLVPEALKGFLLGEGFHVVEEIKAAHDGITGGTKTVHSITTPDPAGIVDSLLRALSTEFVEERYIELDGGGIGVAMSVKVDRYFEAGGKKVAVLFHDNDTIGATLSGLLDLNGYRVVLVGLQDDFEVVAGKLLPWIEDAGNYGQHALWPLAGNKFNIQLTGIPVAAGNPGNGGIFLTGTLIDPFMREILHSKGFAVIDHQ